MVSKLRKKELVEEAKKHAETNGLDVINMKERDGVVALFVDAFMDDPLTEYLTGIKESHGQKEKYVKLMTNFLYDWVNIDMLNQKNGTGLGIKENDELVGAVTIVASECDKKEGFFTIIRKVIKIGLPPHETSEGKKHFHPLLSKRMNKLDEVLSRRSKMLKELGHDRYVYIQQIGVKPGHQGKGIGGKLLRAIFDVAAATNAVCYLETETKENESLYHHLGFKTIDTLKVSVPNDDDDLTFYCMLRV